MNSPRTPSGWWETCQSTEIDYLYMYVHVMNHRISRQQLQECLTNLPNTKTCSRFYTAVKLKVIIDYDRSTKKIKIELTKSS